MDYKTRLFYVVDSNSKNQEIFDNYEAAIDYYNKFDYNDHAKIWVAQVKNAYQEPTGEWNYDDRSDTFKLVAYL